MEAISNSKLAQAAVLAPTVDWSEMRDPEHFVQFYETDSFLLNSLSGYVGKALSSGEAAIVVATEAHRESLEARLLADGLDVSAASAAGQYIALDAAETLAKFMVDDAPEPGRFVETLESVIAQAAGDGQHLRIFGEMVALLWAEGNHDGAIRLEELWNDLLNRIHSFSLFCAYPMNGFGREELAAQLGNVCAGHSRVIPAESYTGLTDANERLRAITLLQQKARSLEVEVAERKEAESSLRAVKDELEIQVEDLRRLHEMSVSLTSKFDIESVLHEVLRAALSVQGTDIGLLSLSDTERDGLRLQVHSGFEKALQQVEWVPCGGGACGTCYEQRRRIVVEDVDADPIFASYREVARAVGFRACHSTPLLTRNGNIIGVLSVHFREPHRPSERELRLMDLYARMAADIIENARLHHQVQQELEQREQLLVREQMARAEAESSSRLKDEFLATVSHELRTPLNAIIGWSHLLGSNNLDSATAARAIETIERNARSQAQLVEDILDVSRVITGKLRLNMEPVDAAAIINAAIDSVQLAADSKAIQLAVVLDTSARRVSGDANRLQQVVWNLLSNAIKFTPSAGRVEIRLERVGAEAEIRVSDTGQGVHPEFLPFIFDRFRQADGTSTRRHGGLGLGLAIVRHLVELHGGTVYADSPGEGQGATFTVRLPLATAAERATGRRRETAGWWPDEQAGALSVPLPSLEDVQVLLVDDDLDTLQMLTMMLTAYRAKVQAVSSVAEALETLRWHKPDVLVSDLAMPEEDGYSLISKVRALEAAGGKPIPTIALTAYVRVEDRARALSAGFNMFVPKPVEPQELIAAIANLAEPCVNRLDRD